METAPHELNAFEFASSKDFIAKIEKVAFIENPLNELASSPTAIVYYGSKCCSLKCFIPCSCLFNCDCDCGDKYAYNTLAVKGDLQKYLFKNIARLDCSICCTDLINRFDYCKSFSIASFDQFSTDAGVETVEMIKEKNCVCCGICSYFLDVLTKPDNRLAGIIEFRGCLSDCCKGNEGCCSFLKNCSDLCYDFYYCCDILSPNKESIYIIYLRKCCLSCFPVGCCGVVNFTIKTPDGTNVGEIEGKRNCCNLCGICGANFTYTIQFPENATPEMKLTIINAVIAIDILIFK